MVTRPGQRKDPSSCRTANSCQAFWESTKTHISMTSRHVKTGNADRMTVVITKLLLSFEGKRVSVYRKNQKGCTMMRRLWTASSQPTSGRSMRLTRWSQATPRRLIRTTLITMELFTLTTTRMDKRANPRAKPSKSMVTKSKISLQFKLRF